MLKSKVDMCLEFAGAAIAGALLLLLLHGSPRALGDDGGGRVLHIFIAHHICGKLLLGFLETSSSASV